MMITADMLQALGLSEEQRRLLQQVVAERAVQIRERNRQYKRKQREREKSIIKGQVRSDQKTPEKSTVGSGLTAERSDLTSPLSDLTKNTNEINSQVRPDMSDLTGQNPPSSFPPITPYPSPPTQSPGRVYSVSPNAREIECDWTPNSDGLLLADARGLSGKTLDEEVARFRDHYLARGTPMVDWNAAWRNWLRSPYRGKETGHAVRQPTDRRERELQRWEDTIAQLKAYGQGKGSFPGGADVGLFPSQQGR